MVLIASRRWWKGGRRKPVEWTAEGGLNREQAPSLRFDGLFPRYQGKARDGAPPSGRFETANLGGTAEVLRLLSQRYLQQVFSWDGGLFLTLHPGIGRHFERGGRHALSSIIQQKGISTVFALRQLHFSPVRGKLVKLSRFRRSGTGQRGMLWKARRNGFSAASSPAES